MPGFHHGRLFTRSNVSQVQLEVTSDGLLFSEIVIEETLFMLDSGLPVTCKY
jgi:hypothetical protein